MLSIRSYEDLERLIHDQVMESLTLDYKQSLDLENNETKKRKLAIEVSAFANSAGGQILYGMKEDKLYPVEIDTGADVSKEWIEQVIDSNIQPRIEGIVIHPFKLPNGWGYCLDIPAATTRAPHQAPDHRYYKRQNFQSVAMEDYEIRDVLRRATTPDLDVDLYFETGAKVITPDWPSDQFWQHILVNVMVINRSSQPAFHVFSEVLVDIQLPAAFATNTYRTAGQEGIFRIHKYTIQSPPMMPIFKEGNPVNHEGSMVLRVTKNLAFTQGASARFKTRVQTPGFKGEADWRMLFNNGTLTLRREPI